MLVFVVTKEIDLSSLIEEILKITAVKSFYLNINDKKTNVVLGNKDICIYGSDKVKEEILEHKFNVSPKTFLQINHKQTEKLYQRAIELLNPKADEVIIDAYCGMGSITLSIAPYVKKVYGIEIVPEAIKDANINKVDNNISNAYFICGKCEEEIFKLLEKTEVDAMVFDPPRKGCEKSFLDAVKKAKIKRIVYISCNVATCARDILYLSDMYKVESVTAVDLFPLTNHVESIVKLDLK